MATATGPTTGSGKYWRTDLEYSVSNVDNSTSKITGTAKVHIVKSIPSSVASSWGRKHDAGWIHFGGTTIDSWAEGNSMSNISTLTSGSVFTVGSGSKNYTRTCSAQTISVQAQNYHSGSGNSTPLVGTSKTTAASVSIPSRPKYTITFDNNGGSGGSPHLKCSNCGEDHKSYGYNATIQGAAPTRTGYTFSGWYTAAEDGTRVTTVTANAAQTLYAHWTANSYVVRYNANSPAGTQAIGSMATSTHTYGISKNLLKNEYYVPGYIFIGWARLPNGNKQYNDEMSVTNLTTQTTPVDLYAVWEPCISNIYVKNNNIWIGVKRGYIKVNNNWTPFAKKYIKDKGIWKLE